MSESLISVTYDHPNTAQTSCATAAAWAKVPQEPSAAQKPELIARIKRMLREQDAVLVAHY